MATAMKTIVSSKGQVILPKAVRDQRRWGAGTRLIVEETSEGVLLKPEPLFPPTTIEQVQAMLRYTGPAKTLEDMDAAVMEEARHRARD
jgi:AbrB family looped-hinge helix DNA binding protein